MSGLHPFDNQCRLRPVSQQDIERSLTWRNDPEVKKNLLSYRLPITKPMEENWIEQAMSGNKDRIVFAIDSVETNKHVGFVELNTIDYFNRNAQLAIVIGDKEEYGKGLGTSTMNLILSYAFNELNLNKVYLQVAEYNQAAQALYAKIGFQEEGRFRKQHFTEGSYHDMIAMGILQEDFTT